MTTQADEETPLLKTGGTGAIEAWVCPDGKEEQEEILERFQAPKVWMLVVLNTAMALGYSAYVLTSWSYATIMHQTMFPPCVFIPLQDMDWSTWYMPGCKIAVLAFWLLPLVSVFVVLGLFYRNCLQSQLYYTLASHRVHLDFADGAFFGSISIWCLMAITFVGLTTYAYYDWSYNTLIYRIRFTIPYWIPIASFAGALWSAWDVEKQLVSLAKVVEKDLDWVKQEIPKTYLIRDYVARKAWANIRGTISASDTTSWVKALVQECARIEAAGGTEHRETLIFRFLDSHYWVTEFLYNDKVRDARATNFHWWFRIFKCFVACMVVLVIYLMTATLFTVFQGLFTKLLGDWSWWLTVGPLMVMDNDGHLGAHAFHPTAPPSTTLLQAIRHVVSTSTTLAPPIDGDVPLVFHRGHGY